jgi:hypothetical protein
MMPSVHFLQANVSYFGTIPTLEATDDQLHPQRPEVNSLSVIMHHVCGCMFLNLVCIVFVLDVFFTLQPVLVATKVWDGKRAVPSRPPPPPLRPSSQIREENVVREALNQLQVSFLTRHQPPPPPLSNE